MKKSSALFLLGLAAGVLLVRHFAPSKGHLSLHGDCCAKKPRDFSPRPEDPGIFGDTGANEKEISLRPIPDCLADAMERRKEMRPLSPFLRTILRLHP